MPDPNLDPNDPLTTAQLDIVRLDERLTAVEAHVGKLERLVDVVTAARADIAAIAEGLDPGLRGHLAELDDTVENHGLLLARLLDKGVRGELSPAEFDKAFPPATCDVCGDVLNAVDMAEHRQQVHGDASDR